MPYRKRQRPESPERPAKFNLKLWAEEKAFLQRAAARTRHKNLSWYITEAAIARAERDLGEKLGTPSSG